MAPFGDPLARSALGPSARAVGIDVGADAAWLVALELERDRPVVADAMLSHPIDLSDIAEFCGDSAVAIDVPAAPSERPHLDDRRVSPKFRAGRCSEVALTMAGISVQFVTPPPDGGLGPASWMRSGFEIWTALESIGLLPVETYPHGVFWRLAGRPLFHKQRPEGAAARLSVLAPHIYLPGTVDMWSHDGLDALAAALVASLVIRGEADRIDCRDDQRWSVHDGSAMYLPKVSAAEGPSTPRR